MTFTMKGKKEGMTQTFDEAGNIVPCTVIHAEPNVITQIKTKENDGYEAIQLGYDEITVKDERTLPKRVSKPLLGHFKKAQTKPCRVLFESKGDAASSYQVGQTFTLALFKEVSHIDVRAVSKGKGYQGVIKRFHFAGGPAAHGSGFHRHGGSMGMRTTPGRTFPGFKKAGRMGGVEVTVQNLRVVAIDEERNLIVVEGAIPGHRGSVVTLSPAIKKINKANKKKGK